MIPSVEQNNFYHELLTGDSNLQLVAAAGSGKTTTIVHACQLLPTGKSVKFLAFNKNIQRELEERLPRTVSVKTFHSEGYGVLRRHCKCGRIDEDKTAKLLDIDRSEFGLYISPVKKLVGYAKNNGLDSNSENELFFALAAHHQMDFGEADEDRTVSLVKDVLARSLDTKVIDFDDMLWLPYIMGLPFDKNNYVFVDEAQDTNLLQRELLRRMVADQPYGRLIAVGDPHQAIYGFRGADADAMGALRDEFQMKEMPLSVSYRCSQEVVKEAQRFIGQRDEVKTNKSITASPNAPIGEVGEKEEYNVGAFKSTDAVLCRNTAPLVSFAFSLIRKDVGCRILGREIGANLIAIINKAKAMDLTDLEQKLISMRKRELDRVAKKFNPSLLSAIEDKYDCLNIFLQNCTSIQNLVDRITTLFDDKAKGLLTLATVHKAKGLEWPTVFILDRGLMPSKWATLPWQQLQERNIQYVAVTRAKLNLYYIESNNWKNNHANIPTTS